MYACDKLVLEGNDTALKKGIYGDSFSMVCHTKIKFVMCLNITAYPPGFAQEINFKCIVNLESDSRGHPCTLHAATITLYSLAPTPT